MKRVEKVAIVGLGLIGGSLGMAFTQGNVVEQVVGIDRDRNSLELGLATQSIHHGTQDLEQGVRGADLVILAVPLGQIVPVAREIKPFLAPGSIVTDVGSTKVDIVKNLEELFYPQIHYVGGHPMAGSERAGIEAADRYLFENAVYLLTPTERTDRQALEIVTALIEKTGARVKTVSPEEHDLIVAAVSHLPHVIAAALVNTVGGLADEYPDILTLAAGGFRDTTRIAGSNPELWRDICLANAEKIIKMIRHFRHWLDQFEAVMAAGDKDTLTGIFRQAQEIRSSIPRKLKGILPAVYELVVTVPDRPGMIAEIGRLLGDEGINIIDIEILRVREGEGGTIRLGFQTEEAVEEALRILRDNGIIVKRR